MQMAALPLTTTRDKSGKLLVDPLAAAYICASAKAIVIPLPSTVFFANKPGGARLSARAAVDLSAVDLPGALFNKLHIPGLRA